MDDLRVEHEVSILTPKHFCQAMPPPGCWEAQFHTRPADASLRDVKAKGGSDVQTLRHW
jgi:hypothetical protein